MTPSIEVFDAGKYKALMDGIECSEVKKSELEFSGRLDAEYYQKQHLLYEQRVKKQNSYRMDKLCHFLIGPFGSAYDTSKYVEKSRYRYIRGQDVKPFFVQNTSPRFITEQDYYQLQKYALNANDLLVSVVGTLGNACIVQAKELPAIFSCKSTAIRTDKIDPYYLLTYINSKYGRRLLLRKERGAIQKGLNLDDLKSLDVPVFSPFFQAFIRGIVEKSLANMVQSASSYNEAQKILNTIYDLNYHDGDLKSNVIKKLSSSFLSTGRLDAEYYQPKYELITNYLNTTETVSTLCNIHDEPFIPQQDKFYKYIELANVGQNGDISNVDIIVGGDLPSRARRRVSKGQVILSSIEGSLQSCAYIESEYNNSLCSTGFYILDSDKINSETLMVLFKSEPMQALLKQRCSGTILTAISKDELQSMPIPIIDEEIQKRIAIKIQGSFAFRSKSKELIEYAKKIIETAIEQNEEVALKCLKTQVGL